MFNQLNSDLISDDGVARCVRDWFKVDPKHTDNEANILSPKCERLLSELDVNYETFDFDFNYSSNPILVCKRFKNKNIFYQSENYNRKGNKRCNYAIRFNGESRVNYGLIHFTAFNRFYSLPSVLIDL